MLTKPPLASKKFFEHKHHKQKRLDEYHWLRSPNWPKAPSKEIIDYLKKENAYTEQFFKPLTKATQKIYKEIIGRIKLKDQSVPIKRDNYYYSTITNTNSKYAKYVRRKTPNGKDEVIFDADKESKGHKYFSLGGLSISPKEDLMAYSLDLKGDEYYTIKVRNLSSKKELPDTIIRTNGTAVWDEFCTGFFYVKMDDNWRATEVYYHLLGTKQTSDKLIYKERDKTFRASVDKTSDDKYILLNISSSTSSEVRYISSFDSKRVLRTLIARKEDHLCDVDHMHDHFYIQTNDKGKNFRLVRVNDKNPTAKHYEEIIPHSKDKYLIDVDLYDGYLVTEIREQGLPQIHLFTYDLKRYDSIKFKDPTYSASAIFSSHKDDGMFISYSSLSTPNTIYRYTFKTKKMKTVKVQEIPSGYDQKKYACERIWAPSRDGKTKIPISLVYKKSLFKKDGSNPLFLYGYGSYGISISASFGSSKLSLLDRGFVYAIAHIRGGDDMGFKWYEDAKFLNKKLTFHDFTDCAKFLVKKSYTKKGNIIIAGGSAGGMLIGVAINEEPELFKAAVAHVPFVDVLNTMLDETLPLTPGEFKEWGNPKEKKFFDYIKSYSPYDNIKAQSYPAMYVIAGLNDPRVTYWEPAKWVAKLRATKTDKNLLLLETNMETGHKGKTGRFSQIKELAKEYVFVLKMFGKL